MRQVHDYKHARVQNDIDPSSVLLVTNEVKRDFVLTLVSMISVLPCSQMLLRSLELLIPILPRGHRFVVKGIIGI